MPPIKHNTNTRDAIRAAIKAPRRFLFTSLVDISYTCADSEPLNRRQGIVTREMGFVKQSGALEWDVMDIPLLPC
jgi:hypothetical protein